ncbi:polysaccharide pyruvyl transferase family protein [Halalkalibaculum sp. DA3122]|uniref:polysaccharide pyruvyl transferase family protein n=1 Tax=Halalkalibaculum sp. DA3122 TaxID=3373607 RepID=UPI003755204F
MEFGNIGNYYIIEPFIRELHRVYPDAEIRTTFQMSDRFCERENVTVIPMEYYYNWSEDDLDIALTELASAEIFEKSGYLPKKTPYIKEVLEADLVIDFSGDIWGDNANLVGDDRFLVGLCKNRVAQLLNTPTAMLAGSPGPFKEQNTLEFAKEVFKEFDLVTNREAISKQLLKERGFDISKTHSLACPSFLFEPAEQSEIEGAVIKEQINETDRPSAGFILCGWNFTEAPFDKWPRKDKDYDQFADAVEYMIDELGLDVFLMSHNNGFPIPPKKFELQHGRDYPIAKQLQTVLEQRGRTKHVHAIDGVYYPKEAKALIKNFDFHVSGRVHGAVAGLSQAIPTVIIDYGHEPKAHKLEGFAKVTGMEDYIADPSSGQSLIKTINECWINRDEVKKHLKDQLPVVKEMAQKSFDLLKEI